jgi:hypothetical protein
LLVQFAAPGFEKTRLHAWPMPPSFDGRARCFCSAAINLADVDEHIYAAHLEPKAS